MDLLILVSRAQNGDSQAFGEIYDLFSQKIFRYVKLKIKHQQEAEDILQQVFLKAWQGLPGLKADSLNFSAWLYKVASNTINDYFRKKYRSPAITELDETFLNLPDPRHQSQTESLDQKMAMAAIKTAFGLLPPQYKEILELRFVQEFSVEETAKITGKSNLSIRVSQFRALSKLRKILKNDHDVYRYQKI